MLLVGLSVSAIVQSVREYLLWERGASTFQEQGFDTQPIEFNGHLVTVYDDQPIDSLHSEIEHEGAIQITMDGSPLGKPSRAGVRRGRNRPGDLGRYHGWFDAWQFRDRASGVSTLWLVRRIQATDHARPQFEIITIGEDDHRQVRLLRGYQLGASYPLFRSTQFVRDASPLSGVPLSVLDFVIAPVFLLIFPFGSLALGGWMIVRSARKHEVGARVS
jgi:hypothetical protein